MMVNYKIVNDKQLIDIGGGYVEQGGKKSHYGRWKSVSVIR